MEATIGNHIVLRDPRVAVFVDVCLQQPEPLLPRGGAESDSLGGDGFHEPVVEGLDGVEVEPGGGFGWSGAPPELVAVVVEFFGEAFVDGPQRSEGVPHRLPLRGVGGGVGVGASGEVDGDDDEPAGLAGSGAHGAADGLGDVDDGAFRVDERDGVDGGHVDAFGQDPGVGEKPPVSAGEVPEPVEGGLAGPCGHRPRGGLSGDGLGGVEESGEAGVVGSEPVRLVDAGVEADGAGGVPVVGGPSDSEVGGEGGGVVLDAVELGEGPPVNEPGDGGVGDDRHDDLEVAQQPRCDRLREAEVMGFGPEAGLVVHRHDLDAVAVRFRLRLGGVDAGRRGEEHPPPGGERPSGQAGKLPAAGDPVGLVHDQQVGGAAGGGQSVSDDGQGGVRDEHDPLPVRGVRDGPIRAHRQPVGEPADGEAVPRPRLQRLLQQAEGRHRHDDQTGPGDRFSDPLRHQGLAGPARHHHPAPVPGLESGDGVRDRRRLMQTHPTGRFASGGGRVEAVGPRHRRPLEVDPADDVHAGGGELLAAVDGDLVGGGEQHPLGERAAGRGGEEAVDLPCRHVGPVLHLDGQKPAVDQFGHQVDAEVLAAGTARPVLVAPDLHDPAGPHRVSGQPPGGDLLELEPGPARVGVESAEAGSERAGGHGLRRRDG